MERKGKSKRAGEKEAGWRVRLQGKAGTARHRVKPEKDRSRIGSRIGKRAT